MKKKTKYIMISVVILIVIVGVILTWKTIEKTKENNDPKFCVERKLGIELGKGVTLVEGNVHYGYGEEHIEAKFHIAENLKNLEEKIETCLYQYGMGEVGANFWKRDDIWLDLKEKKVIKFYKKCMDGEYDKTIVIKAFIATDDAGEYYFYIFY